MLFTPSRSQVTRGYGFHHPGECSREGLRRRNKERRKHPEPEERACEHCGTRFTPTPDRKDARFCDRGCYSASDALSEHGRATLGAHHGRVLSDLEAAVQDRSGMSTRAAAEQLGLSVGKVCLRSRSDELAHETVSLGGRTFYVFSNEGDKDFVREWVRGKDGRRSWWLDENRVIAWYRSRGYLAKLMTAKNLSEQDAEALVRARVQRRRRLYRNHNRGRKLSPGPSAVHLRWLELFHAFRAELEDEHRRNLELGLPSEPPSDWHVALAVAEHDAASNPERWDGYLTREGELDARQARPAADRILKAVRRAEKALQIAQTEIRAA